MNCHPLCINAERSDLYLVAKKSKIKSNEKKIKIYKMLLLNKNLYIIIIKT